MRLAGIVAMTGLAILASGCMTAQELRAADEAQCRSYGFRPRTDAFAECPFLSHLLSNETDRLVTSTKRSSNIEIR